MTTSTVDSRDRTVLPALVAISHGTSSVVGQRAVADLVAAVAERRPDLRIAGGFVDVQQPDVATALASLDRHAVVVPLLLSAGYHVHVDLREELDGHAEHSLSTALGPDDRLIDILQLRLAEAGLRSGDRVVLACAGSSDQRAVEDCLEMGARLSAAIGRDVRVGFISAASPPLDAAIALERSRGGRVVVSTYLLAPGYFADLASSSTADIVTDPLLREGQRPPAGLVELVLERYARA